MTKKLEYFMWEAVLEGRKALPKCLPNPPVGCVLVRDDEIVARGYTNQPGADHAEAMALRQISGDLSNVIAFVTLEPCSFHGRTPSCAKAFVARKIGKVYVAMLDPDPRNNGLGITLLEQAGITVSFGLLQAEAERDMGQYLWKK
jgi:pyrimidine deaminase RibD-like protein